MKLSKEKRDKLALVGIMTLMVLGLFYTFIIGAQRETVADLELKSSGLRDKVDKAQRLKKMGARIEQDLTEARATLQSKEGGMAPADRNRWFFNLVITYMQEHDVSYETSTPEAILSETGLFPKFPFQGATYGVKSIAKFHDYGAFVAGFENKFPYMRVTQMRLQPGLTAARGIPGRSMAAQGAQPEQTGLLTIDTRVMTLVKP